MYDGEVWREFVISCLAMGYDSATIKKSFAEKYGRNDLSDEQIASILASEGEKIDGYKRGWLEELASMSIISRLNTQASMLEELAKTSKDKNDIRAIISATTVLSRYLELLAKISGELKDRKEVNIKQSTEFKVSIAVFDKLADEGIISIKDKPRLEEMITVI